MPKNSQIIARLTMTHGDGDQTVVEIHNGGSFHDFYRWYKRAKGRRAKSFVRYANRNDAANLAVLAERVTQQFERLARTGVPAKKDRSWEDRKITSVKIIVFKKRQYRRVLECPTQDLPGWPTAADRVSLPTIPNHRRSKTSRRLRYTLIQHNTQVIRGKV